MFNADLALSVTMTAISTLLSTCKYSRYCDRVLRHAHFSDESSVSPIPAL